MYLFIFGGDVFSQTSEEIAEEKVPENIEGKYAKILGISEDSILYLSIYQILDKWPEFIASNPELVKQNPEEIFAQYLYYLTFNTKIPADINLIFNDKKTYLFINPIYLRTGDLIFYGKSKKEPDKIAVFLQNNILVYPLSDGRLKFIPYDEIKNEYSLTAAKIERDE